MSELIILPPAVGMLRHFDDLTAETDKLVKVWRQLASASSSVRNAIEAKTWRSARTEAIQAALRRAEALLAAAEKEWGAVETRLARCRAALISYHHPSLYEDGEDGIFLKAEIIADKVSDMIGSFPNGAPHDPERYVTGMIDNVAAVGAPGPAIESAVRRIIRGSKFLPSVSEMLLALDEETSAWTSRLWVLETGAEGDALAASREELAETIAWAKEKLQALRLPAPEVTP
jgi:hypothetical protein